MIGYTCPICGQYFKSPILFVSAGRKGGRTPAIEGDGFCIECVNDPRRIRTTRQRMIAYRVKNGISLDEMAMKCGIGPGLLGGIEGGWITHPVIASKIAYQYELDVDGYNELVHPDHHAERIPVFDKQREWRGFAEYYDNVLVSREKGDTNHGCTTDES